MQSSRLRQLYTGLLLSSLLLFGAVIVSQPVGAQDAPARVLVLNSYHHGMEWSDNELDGIQAVLSDDVDLVIEYMDTKRHVTSTYLDEYTALFTRKYGDDTFDAIITLDDNAFQFMRRNQPALFPGVPVVFGGVNYFEPAMLDGLPDFTGLVESTDQTGLLHLILDLHPDTERIWLITDQTTSGQGHAAQLREIDASGVIDAELVFLNADNTLTAADLLARIESPPRHTIIYYSDFFQDAKGVFIDYTDLMPQLSAAAPVPIYVHSDFYVGLGAVGGKVFSGRLHGEAVARRLRRVLDDGLAPADLPVTPDPPHFMFDHDQLERWNIDPDDLPSHSVIINDDSGVNTEYQRIIWATGAFAVVQGFIIALLATNIVRRRRSEAALRESRRALAEERNLLRTLIDHLPDYVYIKDRAGCFVVANPATAELMGTPSPESMLGKSDHDFYPRPVADAFRASETEIIASGEPVFNLEEAVTDATGDQKWLWTSKIPLRNHQGTITGLVGIGRDITERRHMQQAERDQRTLAEALADTAAAISSALNLDEVTQRILENVGRVVPHDAATILLIDGQQAEIAYCRGYAAQLAQTLVGQRIDVTDDAVLNDMLTGGVPVIINDAARLKDVSHLMKPPTARALAAAPLRVRGEIIGFVAVSSFTPERYSQAHAHRLQAFADQAATAMHKAQLFEQVVRSNEELEQRVEKRTIQLNRAKERVEAILNNSGDAILLVALDGTIQQSNPTFDRMFRSAPNRYYGQPLLSLVDVDSADAMRAALEWVLARQQLKVIDVEVCTADGEQIAVAAALSPVLKVQGNTSGIVCSLRDITERKQLETQLRQALAREMEVADMRSRFLSMAAHDLRNPLTVIKTAVAYLQAANGSGSPARRERKFQHIHESIAQIVELLDDILTIGKVETGKLQFALTAIDLDEFCSSILNSFQASSGNAHRFEFSVENVPGPVMLDAKLMRHIVANLISNSIKYSAPGSTIWLAARRDDDQLVITVRDEGIGIPPDSQPHLFSPFYRADNVEDIPGTGLGLAIVKQAVDLHAGRITFSSQPDEGTTFTITLPWLAPDSALLDTEPQAAAEPDAK